MRFSKRKLHFLFLSFYVAARETENIKKQHGKMAKTPAKIVFFKGGHPKMRKRKKRIFSKNCLALFVSGREKIRAFSCTLSVLAKMFFWTKTMKTRKIYKNSGFSEACPKPKMTFLFGKGVVLIWVKKWVLLTVFLKSCVLLKAIFLSCF